MPVFQRRRRIRAGSPNKISFQPFLGMILMATSFFLYATSGVVAPWRGIVVLMLVWLAMFGLCVRWWTPHPTRLPVVGAASIVLYPCSMLFGAFFLGWTA